MTERKKTGADKLEQNLQVEVAPSDVVEVNTQPITCGLIMPIASNEGGTAEHWRQVREVITSAIGSLNLNVRMVSESEAVNVIHKNIVQNIFSNEIVICDVSSRNPNVMFELGMRLAFDKPVVIIKDRDTPFSFDISSIQHIEYPHSLNYVEILAFQKDLLDKVRLTMQEAKREGKKYSPFLSNYAITEITEIKTEQMDTNKYIINEIRDLKEMMGRLEAPIFRLINNHTKTSKTFKTLDGMTNYVANEIIQSISEKSISLGSMDELEDYIGNYLNDKYRSLAGYIKEQITDEAISVYMNT